MVKSLVEEHNRHMDTVDAQDMAERDDVDSSADRSVPVPADRRNNLELDADDDDDDRNLVDETSFVCCRMSNEFSSDIPRRF